MTDPQVLAIRRNLQSGYIAFKQRGCRLLYTLDNVTWRLAFDYGLCDSQSALAEFSKLKQFVSNYGQNASPTIGASEKQLGTVGRVIQACELSYWIVESYSEVVRKALEAQQDAEIDFGAAVLAVIAAVAGIAAVAVTGGLSLGITASALTTLSASFALTAGIVKLATFADVTAPLNDEQKTALRCCIKNKIVSNFTRVGLSTVVCADVPQEHLTAFNAVTAQPETWAGIVLASQEITAAAGRGCCAEDGCWYIVPSSCDVSVNPLAGHMEYDGASIRTHNKYPPEGNQNVAKSIKVAYIFETPLLLSKIEFDVFTTRTVGENYVQCWSLSPGTWVDGQKPLLAGNKTYTFNAASPDSKLVHGIVIEIKTATANVYGLTQWLASNSWLNAIRVCGTALI